MVRMARKLIKKPKKPKAKAPKTKPKAKPKRARTKSMSSFRDHLDFIINGPYRSKRKAGGKKTMADETPQAKGNILQAEIVALKTQITEQQELLNAFKGEFERISEVTLQSTTVVDIQGKYAIMANGVFALNNGYHVGQLCLVHPQT